MDTGGHPELILPIHMDVDRATVILMDPLVLVLRMILTDVKDWLVLIECEFLKRKYYACTSFLDMKYVYCNYTQNANHVKRISSIDLQSVN